MCKKLIYLIVCGLVFGMFASTSNAEIIAYWPFDEGTASVAYDAIADHDGQFEGSPTWITPGQLSTGAIEVDGSNYVNCGNVSTSGDITLALWIRADNVANQRPIAASNDGYSTDPGWILFLRTGSPPGGMWFRIHGSDSGGWAGGDLHIDETLYEANTWVHVVVTFDSVSREINGYIDGELRGTATAADGRTLANTTEDLRMGNTGAANYSGALDEVAIWDHALTAEEVIAVFNLGPMALDPRMASQPNPADGATDVPRDVTLTWSPGQNVQPTNGNIVYLGTNFTDVNDATGGTGQTDTSYTPAQRLDFDTMYYWRVDQAIAPPDSTVVKGKVWSFTTETIAYPIAGERISATASSSAPGQEPENTVNASGLDANDLHSVVGTEMWLSATGEAGPAWIQYEFDKVLKLAEMQVWNQNTLMELAIGFGIKDATVEYSVDGTDWIVLGPTHEFARGIGLAGYGPNTTVDLGGLAAKYVKITANSNWGGMLNQYGLSEVRFFSVPVLAREPNPASNATDVDVVDLSLSWRAGREAAEHNVYLSTDEQAVIDGTAAVTTVTEAGYAASIDLAETYYWRVDEVNDAETPTMWQGDIWSFSAPDFLVVEDFESYNDIAAGQEGSNLVYETWVDGYANPSVNGSTMGYTVPFQPSMETSIFYDGRQSAPLYYDNTTAGYSEVTANLADLQAVRDWTKHGIKALTLRFSGNPNNSAQQMYVKINGSKVTYDGDAENLTRAAWQMWYIDLASVGVNLSNVTELAIGFERIGAAGGQGTVLIDGIRLYSHDRQLITPVDPGTVGLQGRYQFEGNANDSSGNARHGTLQGGATLAAGYAGQALSLNGTDAYVNVDGYKGVLADGNGVQHPFTVCAWVKATGNGEIITWGTNTGGQRLTFRVDTYIRLEHGSGNIRGTNGPNLLDDEWHHVAASVPEAGLMMDGLLYVDGRDVTPASTTTAPFNLQPDVDVRIGMGGPTGDRFLTGLIDDARIYDRVLTPGEIAALAGQTVPFDESF